VYSMTRIAGWALVPLALVAGPAAVAAQTQDEIEGWLDEIRQIQERLAPLEARALQDPELRAAQVEIAGVVRQAMLDADPELDRRLARLESIQAEGEAAVQAQDQARVAALVDEATTIQQHFAQLQHETLQRPAIAAQVDAFRDRLRARMSQLDAEAPRLLRRFEELEQRLIAAARAAERS
jgi:cell fate (sporulation/competence/biofilm development) regulator YlbF (YheA/YmcA/DUF963 family)